MKKLYIDLAIAVVFIIMIIKYTIPFLIIIGILVAVWFLVLDDKKRQEVTEKVREFYR